VVVFQLIVLHTLIEVDQGETVSRELINKEILMTKKPMFTFHQRKEIRGMICQDVKNGIVNKNGNNY